MKTVESAVGELINSTEVYESAAGIAALLKGVETRSVETDATINAVQSLIEKSICGSK